MPPRPGEFSNLEKIKDFVLYYMNQERFPSPPEKRNISKEWVEYPWHDKLAWCKEYHGPFPALFEKLKIINDFVPNGTDGPLIPIKERSLLLLF
jgi:hypothetical protein